MATITSRLSRLEQHTRPASHLLEADLWGAMARVSDADLDALIALSQAMQRDEALDALEVARLDAAVAGVLLPVGEQGR